MSEDLFDMFLDLDDTGLKDFDRTQVMRAPFGMVGAKWRSLEHILPKLPIHSKSIWAEHFGGTGVISWNVPTCTTMVFNERYSGIVDFYKALQVDQQKLVTILESFPPHSRTWWTDCKLEWVDEKDVFIRAAKWFYMTRLSVLMKRRAFGRGINSRFMPLHPSLELFSSIHQVLKNFTLENLDALQSAKDYDTEQTVHYFDPPYLGTDQGTYENKWTWDNMKDLLRLIFRLKGFVALSHYPDPRIDEYDWDEKFEWESLVTSEPKVFHKENFKEGKENVTDNTTATECLWIKEVK